MILKKFRGVDIEVGEDGQFDARVAGEWRTAQTLKELEAQIEKDFKKTKVSVAIPVSRLGRVWKEREYQRSGWVNGIGVQHLTTTGIHGGSGNVMLKDDKTGDREQITGWRSDTAFVRRMTSAEVDEYMRVEQAYCAAQEARDAFVKTLKLPMPLKDMVKEAQGQKVDTPEEPDEVELSDDPRL